MGLILRVEPGHVYRVIGKLCGPLEAFRCECACYRREQITLEHIGRIELVDYFRFIVESIDIGERYVIVVYIWQKIPFTFMTGNQTDGIPLIGGALYVGIIISLNHVTVVTDIIENRFLPSSIAHCLHHGIDIGGDLRGR